MYVQQTTKGYHASSQKSWNYLSIYEYVLQRKKYHVDEIFECVRINLDFSKEKYTSDFRDTWVVRCSNIDVLLEKVYNISGEVSSHDLHFKIGLNYGQSFTKLVLCLQQENSVNDLVYLWVGSAPENNIASQGFSRMVKLLIC